MSAGQVISFYSYKGGVGRTMTLANIAWILASNGKRVLAIDWHLDAPGLHRYFGPFLEDRLLVESQGVIDFLIDYTQQVITPEQPSDGDWLDSSANILRYAVSLNWDFPSGGSLDFVPAGRQSGAYPVSVNAFNWPNFYERLGGAAFLEAVKRRMREEYDYILIDSAPGIGHASGIATVRMPDSLVVCSTFNRQCLAGGGAVARSVMAQRPDRPIPIFPALGRVNLGEKTLLDMGRQVAWSEFAPVMSHISDIPRYASEVEFLYTPYYEYIELLAPFVEKARVEGSLLASAERLTSWLTNGEVSRAQLPSETDRQAGLTAFQMERCMEHPVSWPRPRES